MDEKLDGLNKILRETNGDLVAFSGVTHGDSDVLRVIHKGGHHPEVQRDRLRLVSLDLEGYRRGSMNEASTNRSGRGDES